MNKYDAANDHYCYKGSTTLKNKLNIQDLDQLEKAEKKITILIVEKIDFRPPPYNLKYMKFLHHQLFSELYQWAGELRNVDISKGKTRFCNCDRIIPESEKLFNNLGEDNWLKNLSKQDFCEKIAEYYCEFNMIHPFREGNGRVQRLFFEHLALSSGYDLDWGDIQKSEWIHANIEGVNINYEPMAKIFKPIVTSMYR